MAIETIVPESKEHWLELRTKDITSTEVSSLFGISPYMTEFELWYRKKEGNVVEIEENERMKWGTLLQDAIAEGISQERNWTIRRMDEYIRDAELRIGSSFDFEGIEDKYIGTTDPELIGKVKEKQFLLEIKNVDSLQYKRTWVDDEPPLHIQIQCQHQMAVSERPYCYLGALVGGNNLVLTKIERNEKIIIGIKKKVAQFWKSVDEDRPPEPNFQKDSEFIASLYNFAEPGKYKDLTNNPETELMAKEYNETSEAIKELEKKKKELKAKLLIEIGDAEKAEADLFKISAGITSEAEVSYTRKAFRNFRLTWKGDKL